MSGIRSCEGDWDRWGKSDFGLLLLRLRAHPARVDARRLRALRRAGAGAPAGPLRGPVPVISLRRRARSR